MPFIPTGWAHPIAFVIGLIIVVFVHMVIGEMVPKNAHPGRPRAHPAADRLPNRVYLVVVRPMIWVLNAMANLGIRALRRRARDELAATTPPRSWP